MTTPPRKPDFSGVNASTGSTSGAGRADFSGVRATVDSTAETAGTTYTVRGGDTLSKIAQQHYGKAGAWQAIFAANRDQLDDPDLIRPGQVLKIPPHHD